MEATETRRQSTPWRNTCAPCNRRGTRRRRLHGSSFDSNLEENDILPQVSERPPGTFLLWWCVCEADTTSGTPVHACVCFQNLQQTLPKEQHCSSSSASSDSWSNLRSRCHASSFPCVSPAEWISWTGRQCDKAQSQTTSHSSSGKATKIAERPCGKRVPTSFWCLRFWQRPGRNCQSLTSDVRRAVGRFCLPWCRVAEGATRVLWAHGKAVGLRNMWWALRLNACFFCERCVFGQGARLLSWRSAQWHDCLGVDYTEQEVQVSVQVEVEREEQGIGETHGKEQRRGTESQRTIKRTTWMTMSMKWCAETHSWAMQCDVHQLARVHCMKNDVRGVTVYTHRRLQWIAIDCKRYQL